MGNTLPKIIGVAGTNGAGKDSVGEMLAERRGWLYISVSDILRHGAEKQGLPIERNILRNLSAQWRRESGLGVLVDKALDEFKDADGREKYRGLAIASLRNPGEADRIHELDGKVVWVDADPKVRYERIVSRLRSDEDRKTYEEFLAEEQAEMEHSGDEATLSINAVKAKADISIENNGNDLETFKDAAEKSLNLAE
jgi:dephospho-CoA kinase